MTSFINLSDKQVLAELGSRFDDKRIQKGIKDTDVIKNGGASSDALNKFRQSSGGITLLNFIRLMRGIGELDALDKLIPADKGLLFPDTDTKEKRKRVRTSNKPKKPIVWGEDS